jgi:streptomycin 6-kinase
MPRKLLELAGEPGRHEWMRSLPSLVEELAEAWSLTVGDPYQPGGQTAWVAPVCGAAGESLVLKLALRHTEALHEADGLRTWDGDGAVRLYEAAELKGSFALLVERCVPGSALATEPEPDQDIVVAALLKRLWREPPPGHQFRPLQVMCEEWALESEEKIARSPGVIDPGLAREGMALFRGLASTASQSLLLCTDLHAANVLASHREPWLVIDPKPYVGDPAYDVLQHMLNCERRLRADPRGLVRRMADLLGLDAGRLVLWLFARCVQEAPDSPYLGEVARILAPT